MKQICSADLLLVETCNIKELTSRNGFPKSIGNSIIKQTLRESPTQEKLDNYGDTIKFFINSTYLGNVGETNC